MEDELEAAFVSELNKEARFAYLAKKLNDGGTHSGFYGDFRTMFKLYQDWIASNLTVWPYPGGRLQQPERITHDFDAMGYRQEFYKLRAELEKDHKFVTKSDAPMFKQEALG
jgi:hypothetical protein